VFSIIKSIISSNFSLNKIIILPFSKRKENKAKEKIKKNKNKKEKRKERIKIPKNLGWLG
jgi:hypothetical protein